MKVVVHCLSCHKLEKDQGYESHFEAVGGYKVRFSITSTIPTVPGTDYSVEMIGLWPQGDELDGRKCVHSLLSMTMSGQLVAVDENKRITDLMEKKR